MQIPIIKKLVETYSLAQLQGVAFNQALRDFSQRVRNSIS